MAGILCQICGKREASTHLTEIDPDGGQQRELHLCASCIDQLGLTLQAGPLPIAQIVKKKLGAGKGALTIDIQAGDEPQPGADVECAACGLSFSEFAVNNRFGCAQCYSDFGERVETLLARYHGASTHVGRRPSAEKADDRLARRSRLDAELRDAIAQEAYERAAALRDEIRRLSES